MQSLRNAKSFSQLKRSIPKNLEIMNLNILCKFRKYKTVIILKFCMLKFCCEGMKQRLFHIDRDIN